LAEEDAPGWGALIDPLASLWTVDLPTDRSLAALPPPAANAGARRHAELGGALIRSLQGMLDVHAVLEAASPCGLPDGCLPLGRVKAAELLPSHALGTAAGPLQLPLYERAMASQQAAAYAYMRAVAETGDAAAAEELNAKAAGAGDVEEDSLVALGDWSVAAGGPGGGGGAEGGSGAGVPELRSAFTRLYMEILTEGAADDLDGLRRDEALDEASLSLLVDALEAGADTFDDAAKGLAMESYDGPRSWWKRSTEAKAGGAGAGAEAASDSAVMGKAVALESELRAMQTKAKGQKKEPRKDTPKVAKSPVVQRATDDAFAKAAAAAAAPPTPSNKKSKPSTPAKLAATPGSKKAKR